MRTLGVAAIALSKLMPGHLAAMHKEDVVSKVALLEPAA
jgi:hypothetical protein